VRVRTGVDIVEVARVARLVTRYETAADRLFTPGELGYCRSRPRRCHEHMAARFAAKEAVLKAIGTGLAEGVRWIDVEVVAGDHARPTVRLGGAAAAHTVDMVDLDISLSHTETHAIACAVALWQ
jgi:holo-[acyl-carrier protein] synthase